MDKLHNCFRAMNSFLDIIQKSFPIELPTVRYSWQLMLLLSIMVWSFSLAVRYLWVFYFHHPASEIFDGDFISGNIDGYFYAKGAQDILDGEFTRNDMRNPSETLLAQLTAFITYILPFSLNKVIFYMPGYVGALLSVVTLWFGALVVNLRVATLASLMAGITWSYYNRTMFGYYDTDMLTVVMPMLFLYFICYSLVRRSPIALLAAPLVILVNLIWHKSGFAMLFLITMILLIYALIYDRKSQYLFKIVAICLVALLAASINTPLLILLPILGVYILFLSTKLNRFFWYIFTVIVGLFVLTSELSTIFLKYAEYLLRNQSAEVAGELEIIFFSVNRTIREAGQIPFETLANRISGNPIIFVLSFVGACYLLFKKRLMLFTIPMMALGLMAFMAGLRFTIFAIPTFALGYVFLFEQLGEVLTRLKLWYSTIDLKLGKQKLSIQPYLAFSLVVALTTSLLANIDHVLNYKPPSYPSSAEIQQLVDFGKKVNREDIAISWWDYGYSIRYYADIKTLVDGGFHSGKDNFGPSFILTRPQKQAAIMARLETEFFLRKNNYLLDQNTAKNSKANYSSLALMMEEFNYSEPDKFLKDLVRLDYKKVGKSTDIYLYLTHKITGIYPTVGLFSYLDLKTGKSRPRGKFSIGAIRTFNQNNIELTNGARYDLRQGMVSLNGQKLNARNVIIINGVKDNKPIIAKRFLSLAGEFNLLVDRTRGHGLLLDNNSFNSLYVQLFYLENYDPNLFELVSSTTHTKIYKLKI